MRWVVPADDGGDGLSLTHRILSSREIDGADYEEFLNPRLARLSDPFLLPGMEQAVSRLLAAIDDNESVVIYGDYDVDGITSVAILKTLLAEYGLTVQTFLPHRIDEGYGLSASGLERCLNDFSPSLLVAVDCGTTSVEQVAKLKSAGVETLIIDHHECKEQLPDCVALVNPQLGNEYHYFCTAGLVFKLGHALLKRRRLENFDLRDVLDLVALGTVADLVPLIGENRILAAAGLKRMSWIGRPGLQALAEVSGLNGSMNSRDVGYRLGPRLNAAGRLETATAALDLLLCDNRNEARQLAEGLDRQNRERQSLERQVLTEAEQLLADCYPESLPAAIVLGGNGWHHGVLGIVASRIMRRYHRPTIIAGFDADGTGKASGRSIPGLSLVEALAACHTHMQQYGGHEMAAGLTINESDFEKFAGVFRDYCRGQLSAEQLVRELVIDTVVQPDDLGMELLDAHDQLEPFGMGNPQPLLAVLAVTPAAEPRVLKEKHLRLEFGGGRHRTSAIYFNAADKELPRPPWDVAFHLERNTYRGRTTAQMNIMAIRQAGQHQD